MTYSAVYNKQARQWDVVDGEGNIVAMCGGGKRGGEAARRKARNLSPGMIPVKQEPLTDAEKATVEAYLNRDSAA